MPFLPFFFFLRRRSGGEVGAGSGAGRAWVWVWVWVWVGMGFYFLMPPFSFSAPPITLPSAGSLIGATADTPHPTPLRPSLTPSRHTAPAGVYQGRRASSSRSLLPVHEAHRAAPQLEPEAPGVPWPPAAVFLAPAPSRRSKHESRVEGSMLPRPEKPVLAPAGAAGAEGAVN